MGAVRQMRPEQEPDLEARLRDVADRLDEAVERLERKLAEIESDRDPELEPEHGVEGDA